MSGRRRAPASPAGFFERRKNRKAAEEVARSARHVRGMREDVLPADLVRRMAEGEAEIRRALRARDDAAAGAAADRLGALLGKAVPPRRHAWLRENFEVLAVAIAVAMGFRTFFLQPFKIPTGSMQPTLYGIHYERAAERGGMDRFPMSIASRVLFGRVYMEMRAKYSGVVRRVAEADPGAQIEAYMIGIQRIDIPTCFVKRFAHNDYVSRGQVLATGVRIAGDHLFVDKARWNFTRPKRGQVMVFATQGILGIKQQNTHYIKRMVGLPCEEIGISPPNLLVNGRPADGPEPILRIQRKERNPPPGYDGYQFPRRFRGDDRPALAGPEDRIRLSHSEYLGFGDNTGNSLDGRYWGPVPERNLTGPALVVYWPLSRRWGPIW